MRTRALLVVGLVGLLTPAAGADESPPATKEAEVGSLASTPLAVPGLATAIAPGREPGTFLVATQAGKVVESTPGKGVTWTATLGEHRADRLVASPRGDVVLASTEDALLALAVKDARILWRSPRPVTFGFTPDGARVSTINAKGLIATLDPLSGEVLSSRSAEDKREVKLASLHTESGLAVLGVADG